MIYKPPYDKFIFESYKYDVASRVASFTYSFDDSRRFTERVEFGEGSDCTGYKEVFSAALELAFYIVGVSYYKTFPSKSVEFKVALPDAWQSDFLNKVYRDGLSQFLFENDLSEDDTLNFSSADLSEPSAKPFGHTGTTALQSGGKDSLLLAHMLNDKGVKFNSLYVQSGPTYPSLLDRLGSAPRIIKRTIDIAALRLASEDGGLNGHVPVTYIVKAYALLDAILHKDNIVLTAVGREGEEPHGFIGDLAVNHQWSKTWYAECLFAEYVTKYISPDIHIGSPLRGYSELKIAEMFVSRCWKEYGGSFSSCNQANYGQGSDNKKLEWCSQCSKCANSYLLFAPFVEPSELQAVFGGKDLFADMSLLDTFKGLLGVDNVMKPFECVGEVGELRLAYHMTMERFPSGIVRLPFSVPKSEFDFNKMGPRQGFVDSLSLA